MLDIKPFIGHPYYANPPWLSHHDYNAGSYYHHGHHHHHHQYAQYLSDAQAQQQQLMNQQMNQQMNNNHANMIGNNVNNAGESNAVVQISPQQPVNNFTATLPDPIAPDPIAASTSNETPVPSATTAVTDENANDVKIEKKEEASTAAPPQVSTNDKEKKPPMTAQVSFEDNHVRVVFTRALNIHVVEVPFPDI